MPAKLVLHEILEYDLTGKPINRYMMPTTSAREKFKNHAKNQRYLPIEKRTVLSSKTVTDRRRPVREPESLDMFDDEMPEGTRFGIARGEWLRQHEERQR